MRYNFVRDAALEEFASDESAYLKDILSRPRVEEVRSAIQYANSVSTDLDDLVATILDEAGGVVVHTEHVSVLGWIQIIVFVVIAAASFALLALGGTDGVLAGVGALVSIAVYIVFSLPERFGRGGARHI
jgi:hypothetical protein